MPEIGPHEAHFAQNRMQDPERLEMVFIRDPDYVERVIDLPLSIVGEPDRGDRFGNHRAPERPGFRQGDAFGVPVELGLQEIKNA